MVNNQKSILKNLDEKVERSRPLGLREKGLLEKSQSDEKFLNELLADEKLTPLKTAFLALGNSPNIAEKCKAA